MMMLMLLLLQLMRLPAALAVEAEEGERQRTVGWTRSAAAVGWQQQRGVLELCQWAWCGVVLLCCGDGMMEERTAQKALPSDLHSL